MRTQFVFADDLQEHTHLGGTILQHYLEIQRAWRRCKLLLTAEKRMWCEAA
jgi:hypothetical protein